jgi:hypothetical protein
MAEILKRSSNSVNFVFQPMCSRCPGRYKHDLPMVAIKAKETWRTVRCPQCKTLWRIFVVVENWPPRKDQLEMKMGLGGEVLSD